MKNKKLFRETALALAISAVFGTTTSYANPTAPTVVNGAVSFVRPNAQTLNITNSPGSIINWRGFSIGAGEATRFIQQNGASAVLNRVTGADPSSILGTLTSNGRVFLVNPNGIVFGGGSVVDVQGLVASTRDISNANFLKGNYLFENGGANSIIMQRGAQIATGNGGQVWLIANNINMENASKITAPQGQVTLAAGTQVQVGESALGNMTFTVTTNSTNTLQSLGDITAESGAVNLFANHITHTGTLDVSGPTQGGTIKLMGDMQTGSVKVSGTLDASAPNSGNGGFIETSAASVSVGDTAKITTAAVNGKSGTWLIDPTDYTIAAVDPANGSSYMSTSTLSTSLANGNVTIQTLANGTGSGDIFVNDPISWGSPNNTSTLTLSAHRNININARLWIAGAAGLTLNPNTGGTGGDYFLNNGAVIDLVSFPHVFTPGAPPTFLTPSLTIAGTAYTVINIIGADVNALQNMNSDLAGHYALGSNINGISIANFMPIGYSSASTTNGTVPTYGTLVGVNATPSQFTGVFDGLGHQISNLSISNSAAHNLGLFSWIGQGGVVRNVGLVGGSITGGLGYSNFGMLAGWNFGTIANTYATGNVAGGDNASNIGGLVGWNWHGAISNSYASVEVRGGNNSGWLGGLVGFNGYYSGNNSSITNSYAIGNVTGGNGSVMVGGLVGDNDSAVISNSYATGNVIAGSNSQMVGGLVGDNNGYWGGDLITNSSATGSVTGGSGSQYVGGLVGVNLWSSTLTNSYATGNVSGGNGVGGLVGWNGYVDINQHVGSTISTSYATGLVIGVSNTGGLLGYNNSGTIINSYWDTQTSGQAASAGGNGLTTAQMMTQASFIGFDFTNTWWMSEGNTRPFLRNEYSANITNAHQLQLMALNLGASYTLANNIDMGELTRASGMWNTATGFVPVGDDITASTASRFTGTFDGLGYTISNLTIYRPTTDNVGLFGITHGTIQNVALLGGAWWVRLVSADWRV